MAYNLIKYGANPYIKDNENNSAIYIFTKCIDIKNEQNSNLLNLLIQLGFDIDEKDKDGRTLLMEICTHKNTSLLKLSLS